MISECVKTTKYFCFSQEIICLLIDPGLENLSPVNPISSKETLVGSHLEKFNSIIFLSLKNIVITKHNNNKQMQIKYVL